MSLLTSKKETKRSLFEKTGMARVLFACGMISLTSMVIFFAIFGLFGFSLVFNGFIGATSFWIDVLAMTTLLGVVAFNSALLAPKIGVLWKKLACFWFGLILGDEWDPKFEEEQEEEENKGTL